MAKTIKKYSKIALIVGLSLALIIMHVGTSSVKAGTLTSKEVKISDSRPSQTAVYYDFLATEDTGGNINCIKVEFCENTVVGSCTWTSGDDMTSLVDISTTTGFDWNNLDYDKWEIPAYGDNATTVNSIIASTTDMNTESIGTGGSFVFGNMINPTASSTYYAHIRTYSDSNCLSGGLSSEVDRGVVAFAVIGGVTVSATVAETLTVSVNASSCTNFITGGSNVSSATTSINFGTVNSDTFYNSCQRLDIGTNAVNGYTATIRKTQKLTYGGETLDDWDTGNSWPNPGCDDTCSTTTDGTWNTAGENGFGYCMKDETLNGATVADADWATYYCGAGTQHFKMIDDNEPGEAVTIMRSTSATSTNQAWVGYRLTVDSSKPAGTYETVIIYVATPNY